MSFGIEIDFKVSDNGQLATKCAVYDLGGVIAFAAAGRSGI